MNKQKAQKAIDNFREHAIPAVLYDDVPATKEDLRRLVSQISALAQTLLDSFVE